MIAKWNCKIANETRNCSQTTRYCLLCGIFFFFISIPVLPAYVSSISCHSISYSILMFILFLIGETESQYVTRLFLMNATSTGSEKRKLFYKMQSNCNYLFINKWALFLWTEFHFLFFHYFFSPFKRNRYQFNEQPNKTIPNKQTFKRKLTNLVSITEHSQQPATSNQYRRWEKIAVQKSWKPKLRDYYISFSMCIGLQFTVNYGES